jgi:hypothetical protein
MADRYWVGGAGTWDATDTTHWSTASGGAPGAPVPTAADNVFFNSASNATAYAVTLGSNFVGTASFSIISSLTSTVTVATVTSGSLAVGNLIVISSTLFRITSLGTGTGGVGTYNCSVLRGNNGTGNSGSAAYSPAPICADISFAGPAVGTLTWVTTNSAIEVTGSATVAASGVTMVAPLLIYTGSGIHTITTNSVSMASAYLAGTGTYTLGSAYIAAGSLYFCLGTFTTANFALTVSVFDQDSATTRTINLGSSTVTISGSSYPVGSGNPSSVFGTNVTFNAGTSQVNFTASSSFYISFGLNKTWYNVSLTNTGINQQTSGGIKLGYGTSDTPTFNNFSIAGQAVNTGVAQIFLRTNMTINGTFTIGAAASAITRLMLRTDTVGTARTITAAAFAAGATDVDWQDITIAGAAGTISGTRFGDCGGCTNITFDAAKTVYWNLAGAQNWSATAWATSSGASPAVNNFPLAQDTAVFDNTGSVTGTITIEGGSSNQGWNIGTLDMSARTSAMTLAASSTNSYPWIFGSWINGSGVTISGVTGVITFSNRSTKTINSAGKTFTQPITIDAPGGGLQLLTNNLTTSSTGTLTRGTLNLNNLTFSALLWSSTNTNTRTIAFGTGSIVITAGASGGVFDMSVAVGFSYTGTSNVVINGGGSKDFRFGSSGGGTESNALSFAFVGTPDATGFGVCKNLNLSGCTAGASWSNATLTVYGNATFNSSVTVSASPIVMTFANTSGTQILTTNGATINFPIVQNSPGATVQLGSSFTSGNTYTLTAGTLSANNYNVTIPSLSSSGSTTRSIVMGSETWTISGSGSAWDCSTSTNLSVTPGTSKISMTSASTKTFAGGSKTWGILNQGGAGALTITGTNSFADIQASSLPSTIIFPASVTTTVSNFTGKGTSGNLLTLQSSSAGTQFNISKSSGAVYSQYLSLQDSNATGGANWRAGTTSTFVSNVSGWLLLNPPTQIRASINSSGVLFVPTFNQLNEVSKSINSVDDNAVYSNLFDETQSLDYNGIPVAQRKTADGKLLVSGYFDEITLQ